MHEGKQVTLLSLSWKPALHATPQVLAPHVALPFEGGTGHTVEHPPQWRTSSAGWISQPFAGLLSQSEKPALHA